MCCSRYPSGLLGTSRVIDNVASRRCRQRPMIATIWNRVRRASSGISHTGAAARVKHGTKLSRVNGPMCVERHFSTAATR